MMPGTAALPFDEVTPQDDSAWLDQLEQGISPEVQDEMAAEFETGTPPVPAPAVVAAEPEPPATDATSPMEDDFGRRFDPRSDVIDWRTEARRQLNPDIQAAMAAEFMPPEVDAISGDAPIVTQDPRAGDFSAYMERQLAPATTIGPESFDLKKEEATYQGSPVPESVYEGDLQEQELKQNLTLSPAELAAKKLRQEAEAAQFLARRGAEEADKQAAREARTAATYRVAVAKTERDVTNLRTRIDELSKREPEGFFEDMDAEGIAGIVQAVLLGFVSPLHGLATLTGAMRKKREREQQELQNDINLIGKQAGLLGEELAIHGDLYKAQQAVDLAGKRKAISMLKAEFSKFNRGGSIAMAAATAIRQAEAEAAAAQAAAEKELLERNIKVGEYEIKAQEAADKHQKHVRDMAPKPSAPKMAPEHWKSLYGVAPPVPMSEREFKSWIGTTKNVQELAGVGPDAAKKAADLRKAEAEATVAERRAGDALAENPQAERLRTLGVGGLQRKDGKPILARSVESAEKLSALKASTDSTARELDELIALREKYGWSSDLFQSKEWRQMQANQADLVLKLKDAASLGALSAQEIDLVANALGAKDPTSVRDPTEGWKKARQNVVEGFNEKLRSADPDAKRYEPPRLESAAAYERSKGENARILTQGIPPHVTEEGERRKYVERSQQTLDVMLRRQKPSATELQSWARDIDKQVTAGTMSRSEAVQIVSGMAAKVAAEEKERIERMSTDELRKAQSDPAFAQRAGVVNLIRKGAARPEEIYRLVVGQ